MSIFVVHVIYVYCQVFLFLQVTLLRSLFNTLSTCQICIGNSDFEFLKLPSLSPDGTMRDKSSMSHCGCMM